MQRVHAWHVRTCFHSYNNFFSEKCVHSYLQRITSRLSFTKSRDAPKTSAEYFRQIHYGSAGDNSQSLDIVQPNFEKCHIMIGQDDRTSHQHIFFKVLLMNKLCLVKYLKCPTTRKIWKDTCPANKEKIISSNVIVTKIIFQVKVCDKILYETFISGNEVWNKLLTELKTQHRFELWNLWIAIPCIGIPIFILVARVVTKAIGTESKRRKLDLNRQVWNKLTPSWKKEKHSYVGIKTKTWPRWKSFNETVCFNIIEITLLRTNIGSVCFNSPSKLL